MTCKPLATYPPMQLAPEICVTSDNVSLGTVCSFECDFDLTFVGDTRSVTCVQPGKWIEAVNPDAFKCIGLSPNVLIFVSPFFVTL